MSDASTLPGGPQDRRGSSSRGDRGPAFSAARGAALIGVAVIIGIVLLQYTDDGTTGPVGDGGNGKGSAGTTTSSTAAAGTGDTTATTAAATAAKPPAQVTVLVLNGSGAPGAATAQTDQLKAKGYATRPAADSPARQGTVVEFKPGFDRECATVATSVGGSPKVEPISNPPPTGSELANCVVILGS